VLRPRPAQAADELLLYLRLPGDLAPHKFEAAWVLGSAARESEPDSALLSAALAEPDMAVRRYAALAAGVSGDAKLAPQLAGRLSDAEPAVRLEAARALGRIGAADSAPALTKATGDGDLIVRLAATAALTWVAPASAEAKAALAKAQAEVEKAGIPAVIHAAYKRSQDQDPSGGAWLVQVICRPAALRFCSAMVIDDHYEVDMNMDLRDLRGGRRDCVTEEGAKLLKTQGYVDLKPFLLVALPGHPQGAYIYIRRGDPKGVGAPGPEASPAR
jgi:hypothetical protein